MIYLIYTTACFIVAVTCFTAYHYKWLILMLENRSKQIFTMTAPIIERAYKAVDFRSQLSYISEDTLMRYGHHVDIANKQIIHDDKHREYMIDNMCKSLTKEMLKAGVVEIRDTKDDVNHFNPYQHTIEMRIKAYKPG